MGMGEERKIKELQNKVHIDGGAFLVLSTVPYRNYIISWAKVLSCIFLCSG